MEAQKNILIAFILNLVFSVVEAVGGLLTNSFAIFSDALHDFADALSIGVSYFLEKKSHHRPDNKHTYGYARYSTLGALITTVVLLFGSGAILVGSISRLFEPTKVESDGMLIFAIFGVILNGVAVFVTREKSSTNQRAVNLHMLEDVLGWVVVLVGATVIKFTGWHFIDPLMSLGVAIFLVINAIKNLVPIINVFLDNTPLNISVKDVKKSLKSIDGVEDIHHLHIWSADEHNIYATMHIVTDKNSAEIKSLIRENLKIFGITHAVIETETIKETCSDPEHHHEISHHHHH